jgi:hypothetical protein
MTNWWLGLMVGGGVVVIVVIWFLVALSRQT